VLALIEDMLREKNSENTRMFGAENTIRDVLVPEDKWIRIPIVDCLIPLNPNYKSK
jgi:hypothetical protein